MGEDVSDACGRFLPSGGGKPFEEDASSHWAKLVGGDEGGDGNWCTDKRGGEDNCKSGEEGRGDNNDDGDDDGKDGCKNGKGGGKDGSKGGEKGGEYDGRKGEGGMDDGDGGGERSAASSAGSMEKMRSCISRAFRTAWAVSNLVYTSVVGL